MDTTLLSVFSPSHKPTYLQEAHASLQSQTHKNWEWIIGANGAGADAVCKMAEDFHDSRIRCLRCPPWCDTIGGLKNWTAMQGRGEVLVELDHDDILHEDCLHRVADVYHNTHSGFIFSDSIGFCPEDRSETYSSLFGWTGREQRWRDKNWTVMQSFNPVLPRSLCEIYFAPNHVRCWSREAYDKVGGHDPKLAVADDHDILCRTYLAGVNFHFIDEVLYYYRRHEESTCIIKVDEIGRLSAQHRNKYLQGLAREWCRREGLLLLDLGGAFACPRGDGYKAVDRQATGLNEQNTPQDVEIVCDVTKDIPVPDGSVGIFRAVDFLEHIEQDQQVALWNRLYDKLANHGWFFSWTPAVCDNEGRVGRGAFQDPTHRTYFSANNIWYYTDRNYAKYVPEIRCRFQAVRLETVYPSEWHAHNLIPYLAADLMALKGGRVAGFSRI
jgi:glycosyltransferase involved in cell wall biosynthesis